MSNHPSLYERDLNDLLFEAQNKLDDFTEHKITIIKAGCDKQNKYLDVLRDCVSKQDEVLAMEQYVADRFRRALPAQQLTEVADLPRVVQRDDRLARIAKDIHDEKHPLMRRIA